MDAEQLMAIVGAIVAGLGGIGAAVKWGLGRVAKAFDDMAAAFDRMAETLGSAEKRIIKLESVVEEGRDDIRELRGGGHPRSAKRAATPSG